MVIVQIVYGEIPAQLRPYVESVRMAWPTMEYRLIERGPIADPRARCIESDQLRFELAREIGPAMAYFDLDMEIVKPFSFDEGPCFGFRREQPGCFVFYGLTGEFLDMIDARLKERGISKDTYCWPAKVLRDVPVKRIPDVSYVHHAYTLNQGAGR